MGGLAREPARKPEFLFFAGTALFVVLTFLLAANTLTRPKNPDSSHIRAGEDKYDVSFVISAVHIEQKNFLGSAPKNPVFRRYLENAAKYGHFDWTS